MTQPIKLSELERLIEYSKAKDWYTVEAGIDTISRLCEALRIAHNTLESIVITRDMVLDEETAKEAITKINSLVDLS